MVDEIKAMKGSRSRYGCGYVGGGGVLVPKTQQMLVADE